MKILREDDIPAIVTPPPRSGNDAHSSDNPPLPQSEDDYGEVSAAAEERPVSLDDFRGYMPLHTYVYLPTRDMWPAASVDSRIPPIPIPDAAGKPVLLPNGEPKKIRASTWLDRHRPVEQMTWSPGEEAIIADRLVADGGWIPRQGAQVLNLYRPPTIKRGDPAKAKPWIDHVHKVYPSDAEHIICWLAQRVQTPEIKINHALVIGGGMGIGKDTILEPIKSAVGPWNFKEVDPTAMLGRFNGHLKAVILRVSEARDLGDVDRYSFHDHLKAILASPPDVLRIDEKNIREYSIFNVVGVTITTNHKTDGIYLPPGDRRHYVAWSDLGQGDFSEDYWTRLWGWYRDGGVAHVAAYLHDLDISGFNPKAPPPKTAAWHDIVSSSRAPEDVEMADILDLLGNPDVVTISEIVTSAPDEFCAFLRDRKNSRRIPHRFEACEYAPFRNPNRTDGLWRVNGKSQVVYAKKTLSIQDQHSAVKDRYDV